MVWAEENKEKPDKNKCGTIRVNMRSKVEPIRRTSQGLDSLRCRCPCPPFFSIVAVADTVADAIHGALRRSIFSPSILSTATATAKGALSHRLLRIREPSYRSSAHSHIYITPNLIPTQHRFCVTNPPVDGRFK